ncbi:MAG: flagellar basal body rod protein FlgC [Myxococcales bacterium]|jgi:flagellar basal-body rod protein FlgC|nr:flagellar basal body rod protein FlgC [Myxococcales bacterium]
MSAIRGLPPNGPGVFSAMEVAASGLTAERSRMNVIASNLANARTTRGADGEPYKRIDPVFEAKPLRNKTMDAVLNAVMRVDLAEVREDTEPGQMVYDPGHPDADGEGYVEYPNVNVVTEMVNLMTASRAYEAGVATIESVKTMARSALKIGQ